MINYKQLATDAIRNLHLEQSSQNTTKSFATRDRDAAIRAWDELEREAKLQEAREGNAL